MNGTFVISLLTGMVLGRVGFSLVAWRLYDESFFFFPLFTAEFRGIFGVLSHFFFFSRMVF